ncbi:MAG TPA: DUF1254 domain-containing protein [Schlesneria sp.]
MRARIHWTALLLLGTCLLCHCVPRDAQAQPKSDAVTPGEARAIAKEAYIYGFPLVDNYRVLHSYFVDRNSGELKAPWNQLHNETRVYTPEDKAIQTPNSDTPYSQLGTDLRAEPLVITVPPVDNGRYYSLQFIDAYTFNFAYVGSRSTGNGPGRYLLAGPNWNGEKPEGIDAIIRSETEIGWILYRTQLFKPDDIDEVRKVQMGYKVQPLSSYLGKQAPIATKLEFARPLTPELQKTSPEFFQILNFVLGLCPTHPSERELMARFSKLGIGPGGTFDSGKLSPEIRNGVQQGMVDAWNEFLQYKKEQIDTGERTAADGFGTREFLKNNYLSRMSSAVLGIYGNSKEEALYPAYFVDAGGNKLDASKHRYALRFAPGELPPVNAFWSLTMYSLPKSLLVANPLKRYLINSPMLPDLKRDADGGVTLYLQHDSPGNEKESNWLPAPDGEFFSILRLYWPKEEALAGRWKQPPLQRIGGEGTTAVTGTIVTVDNFVRAESDAYFAATIKGYNALGQFSHNRVPTPIDKQTVVRMNRDTLYSAAVFDLDAGSVKITLPDAGKRFLSMQVINQDHYTPFVAYERGSYTLNRESMGTRYVLAAVRILADPSNPVDIQAATQLQDAIKVEQASKGTFKTTEWDEASQKTVRDLLIALGSQLSDTRGMFGTKAEVQPVRHLIGSAMAWGGNPDKDAFYLNVTPKENDGRVVYRMTIKDVPVDGFWSISVYNAEGFFEENNQQAYTINNVTAKTNADGSVTVQFGGCEGSMPNCLPITPGWNYMVRLYRPRKEILEGKWKFPTAEPVR